MNHRKMPIYLLAAVTLLAALAFTTAGVASIITEAKQQADAQQQTMEPIIIQATPVVSQTAVPALEPQPAPKQEAIQQSISPGLDFSGKDKEILLKIAMAEAEGEIVEGKALVMLVVLNRVWSEEFPASIEEVVFQENQFSPTVPGGRYWTTTPDAGCYEALEMVANGWDESQGALYFESTGRDGWHSQNLEFLFQLGGHKFYR